MRRMIIVFAVVALMLSGTVVLAQVESSDDVIYGCLVRSTGVNLRIVDGPDGCRPAETLIMWNVEGPPGPQGIQGIQGEPGEPGVPGAPGADGADGVACWDLDGNGIGDPAEDVNGDGAVDVLDCRGPEGPEGPEGPQGPIGETGPQGPPGLDAGEPDPNPLGLQMFLQVDGIEGDSTNARHRDWIDVGAYAHEIAVAASGALPGPAVAVHRDFEITLERDPSMIEIIDRLLRGGVAQDATLDVCLPAVGTCPLAIEFEDVRFSVIGYGESPLIDVAMSYQEITWRFKELDGTGSPTEVVTSWDLVNRVGTNPGSGPGGVSVFPGGGPYLMELEGLTGESVREGFEGWIELNGFDHAMTTATSVGGVGVADVGLLYVEKQVDIASPGLLYAVNTGRLIPTGTILVDGLEIGLENVMVASIAYGSDQVETVGLQFETITWSLGGSSFGWDVELRRPL